MEKPPIQRDSVIAPLGGKLQTHGTPSAAHFMSDLYNYHYVRLFARALPLFRKNKKSASQKPALFKWWAIQDSNL